MNKVGHPRNVYLREDAVMGPLDGWLARVFDPDNMDETLDALHAASEAGDDAEAAKADAARKRLADCDKRLSRYRAALDSGRTHPSSPPGSPRYKPSGWRRKSSWTGPPVTAATGASHVISSPRW